MTKEEALISLNRHGRVLRGAFWSYGHVCDVHHSGLYVKFSGSRGASFWVASKDVELYALHPSSGALPSA